MNLVETLGVQFPKNTKVQSKDALVQMIERMIMQRNFPLVLNQRSNRFTRRQVDTGLSIGEANPSIFEVNRASSTDKYLSVCNFNRLERRQASEMSLTKEAYESVKHLRSSLLTHHAETDEECSLNLYFDKHQYKIGDRLVSRWVTVAHDGRITHPMTNEPRSNFHVAIKENEIVSLDYQEKLNWSIDGDSDLVLLDYKAFAPTVISTLNNTSFKDYPEIEGFTRDQVKQVVSAIRQGSRDRVTNQLKRISRPKQIEKLGSHSCQLSNQEVLEIVYDACPALLLPLELIKRQYIETETRLLREVITSAKRMNCGIIPLHDGVIVPRRTAWYFTEVMQSIGSPFNLTVVVKDIEKSTIKFIQG